MSGKKSKLIELDIHRRKLVVLMGELLKTADEVDRSSKLASLSPTWHERFTATCSELAALNEAVSEVEALVKSEKVGAAEDTLLRCTEIAKHLSRRLNELKREVHQC